MSAEDAEMEAVDANEGSDGGDPGVQPKRPRLAVPSRRFVNVGYPGYVENISKVIDTLGGADTLASVWKDGGERRLELRFRRADTNSHPLTAEREKCTALLLRVCRPEGGGAGGGADPVGSDAVDVDGCTASVVGLVDHEYSFSEMADFQFLAGKPQFESEDLPRGRP